MFNLSPENINYQHFNERDIEIPVLENTIAELRPDSLLDVGAFYSYNHYAHILRVIMSNKIYDAIDIRPDPITETLTDHYVVGNICDTRMDHYDSIICISAIEHAGLHPYTVDNFRIEQNSVFARVAILAQKHFLFSFPFGTDEIYPDQYANITNEQLDGWEKYARQVGFQTLITQFWFNQFPQGKEKWNIITREQACTIPLRTDRGAQCICFFEAISN